MSNMHGFVAAGFEPVAEAFEAQLSRDELGAAFAAIQDGEMVVDLWGGFADRAREKPWAQDTLVPVYSTTKPIAALVAALCVERGQLDYDAPVADVWPEFAASGKGGVTLAQMLSHQAGLPGFVEPIDPALWLDPPACAAHLASLAPMWAPGSTSGYHPLTWGYLIGEVVARAAGRTLGTVLREDICKPAGIDFAIGLPASEHARCAEIRKPSEAPKLGAATAERKVAFLTKWAAPDRGGPIWREIEIPSANGHGTARSVAQLYSIYAAGGKLGDRRLLSGQTFSELTKSRFAGADLVLPFAVNWAAGVMINSQCVYGPNPDGFGHSGWGGSMGLADPDRQISAGYVMNQQSSWLQGDPRAQALVAALFGCF